MMKTSLKLVQAEYKDSDLVALLVHQLFKELFLENNMPSNSAIVQATEALLSEGNGFSTLLAIDDNTQKPLGIMTITSAIALKTGAPYAIVLEIFVSPSERSRGVGELMMARLKEMGTRYGWTRLETVVPPQEKNLRAIEFFQRCNFVRVGDAMTLSMSDI